jgi:hypothetical protein
MHRMAARLVSALRVSETVRAGQIGLAWISLFVALAGAGCAPQNPPPASTGGPTADSAPQETPMPEAGPEKVAPLPRQGAEPIAIAVALRSDSTLMEKALPTNAQLRRNYAAGFALDAAHPPYLPLARCFLRASDFEAATAAVTKALAGAQLAELPLRATGYDDTLQGGVAVTSFVVESAPALLRLQEKVAAAIAPFATRGGNADAFAVTPELPEIGAETVQSVEEFLVKASGKNYAPRITVGLAPPDYVQRLKALPFEAFPFKAESVAIYQLGNFGTAQTLLWVWKP